MPKKLKDTEYLFLTAVLRAREPRMLTREKMERMLDTAAFDDAAKLLEDSGFEDMSKMTARQIEDALGRRRAELFEDLIKLSPEPRVIDIFRLKYDYHNIKTLIKAEGAGVDGSPLLSDSGRFEPKLLAEAFPEEKYDFLPDCLAEAAREAKAVLARTGNPQLADFILDRAQYAEMLSLTAEVGSDFLTAYARISVDSANLRCVVRAARMKNGAGLLRSALIPGGNIGLDKLREAHPTEPEGLAAIFATTFLEYAAEAGAEAASGGSLTKFELECDNAMNSFLGTAKLVSFGEAPIAAHIAAQETELMSVRMILTGRLAGVDAGIIRERLREAYA